MYVFVSEMTTWFLVRLNAGHSEETSQQGYSWAAGPHRYSLRAKEEGGAGIDRPQGKNGKKTPLRNKMLSLT